MRLTDAGAVLVRHAESLLVGVEAAEAELAAVAAGRLGVWAQQSVPEWDWLPGAALVTAAGGRADQVEARGHVWSVAGRPTAVGQVVAALQS